MNKPQIVELFAGAGGMALGLEAVGCVHRAMLELDADACATLRANWTRDESPTIFEGDVREFDYRLLREKVGEIDGVVGGPPCQPFSLGGVGKGAQDARNMFPETARAIAELRPKFFLFENVKGLLRDSFAPYFEYIVDLTTCPCIRREQDESWREHWTRLRNVVADLENVDPSSSYRVAWKLVDAADYGVPQRRSRVFIAGVRRDIDVWPSFPTPTHSLDRLLWDQWVSERYWDEHKVATKNRPEKTSDACKRVETLKRKFGLFSPASARYATVRDALSGLPDPSEKNDALNHEFRPGARPYPGHTGSAYDEPSKALKAGVHGVPGGENMIAFPDGTFRYYTTREAARIQTFPDSYAFCGAASETMRQIGNAAPVKLTETIAKFLLEQVA